MRIIIRRVHGNSMLPHLSPGQIILANKRRRVRVGDVVVFYHEGSEKVKQVAQLHKDKIYVRGFHEQSTDSRDFGWLGLDTVVATVVWPRTNVRLSK